MAKARSEHSPSNAGWAALTCDDLTDWAGSRSVARGWTYQRGGRVKDLRISADGAFLATVTGTHRYATTVSVDADKKRRSLDSACTCPIGSACKHAVAVVAEYLDALAKERAVPTATEDDRRWADIEAGPMSAGEWYGDEGDWDEDEGEEEYDDEEEPVRVRKARPARTAAQAGKPAGNWDDKIERHIRSKPPAELADLVWSLARRYPELYREFRERIALSEGDVSQLVAEARKEIRKVTSVQVWRSNWTAEGQGADYTPIRHRFERLLELGHADEVVALGRDFIRLGLRQVGESHDEGETASDFADTIKVVGRAVLRSSMSGAERLQFAIDAELHDDYDTTADATEAIFAAATDPKDWSKVADALLKRLRAMPSGSGGDDSYSRGYQRDRLTGTIADALKRAGREPEVAALYESEVRTTQSYERYVGFLLEAGRVEDAERWAKEGIAATREKWPGIASHLAEKLREIAAGRKQWDVVAAHVAVPFFERPSAHGFDELMAAAKKAKVEEPVRAAALEFLETGAAPFRIGATPAPKTAPKSARRKKAAAPAPPQAQPATPASRLQVDPAWPLPVPDSLVPFLEKRNAYDPGPRPHLGVLVEMALKAKRPDEVLRWYDKMRAAPRPAGYYHYDSASQYAERVADAVAATHPERAIEVYRAGLDANLRDASPSAYEAATKYLRKLRPVYDTLGRGSEWTALLAKIREEYKRRRLFMAQLDTLEGKTILQSVRKAKK